MGWGGGVSYARGEVATAPEERQAGWGGGVSCGGGSGLGVSSKGLSPLRLTRVPCRTQVSELSRILYVVQGGALNTTQLQARPATLRNSESDNSEKRRALESF